MNVYIHIPFCKHKCSYCHFFSTTNNDAIDSFVSALITDIREHLPQTTVETIYFGGGTPSLLSTIQLRHIIETVLAQSNHQPREITLEANPESLIEYPPYDLLQTGINRLSIGIQSWQPEILDKMGRHFDAVALKQYIEKLREYGLQNLNLDHIIAFPGQTGEMIQKDIELSLSLNPTHISVYPLEIHENTSLFQLVKNRQLHSWSDDEIVKAFSGVQLTLQKHGYRHYEELNFARPGHECLHNLHFWQGKDYLGFGPGAVSRIGSTITENLSDVNGYITAIQKYKKPFTVTTKLTPKQLRHHKLDLKNRLFLQTN